MALPIGYAGSLCFTTSRPWISWASFTRNSFNAWYGGEWNNYELKLFNWTFRNPNIKIPHTQFHAMKLPAPIVFHINIINASFDPVYTIPRQYKYHSAAWLTISTILHEDRSCQKAPQPTASMNSHGIQRIIYLDRGHSLGHNHIEQAGNTRYQGSSPRIIPVTTSTDRDHSCTQNNWGNQWLWL
jgi:hypothetical protein